MTDYDIMAISIVVNIGLLLHNYIMHKRYETLGMLFAKTVMLVGAIADGKAMPYRNSKHEIHIKDLRNEKDKPSTATV